MSQPEILSGGNSNRVVRDGATVVRNTGPWSPLVHALLQYLTAAGFNESPVLIEDLGSQERLSFIEGEVGNYPLKPSMLTDAIVIEAAQLLRQFHDLTQHFVIPPGSVYQLSPNPDSPHEVICHNDFAPYNCVFRDGHLVGLIDFDTAGPGTRLWDVAYAVYRFAPLATDQHCRDAGWQAIPDRAYRLRLFCDAYGLEGRGALIDTVIQRIERLMYYMRASAFNLDHLPVYVDDRSYIYANRSLFASALDG